MHLTHTYNSGRKAAQKDPHETERARPRCFVTPTLNTVDKRATLEGTDKERRMQNSR